MRSQYVIVSDLHIGSGVSQSEKILHFLDNLNTDVLVLAGDIIDVDHTKRLNKRDWEIFSKLRKLSKKTRVICLPGNHDAKILGVIADLLGFEYTQEFEFLVGKRRILVTHGDRFDHFISKFWLITEIASGVYYYYLQRFSSKKQVIARSLKRHSKSFVKCVENVKKGAINYAQVKGYDTIIVGHTHCKEYTYDGVYLNSGCWTEVECSYVEINRDGIVQLKVV